LTSLLELSKHDNALDTPFNLLTVAPHDSAIGVRMLPGVEVELEYISSSLSTAGLSNALVSLERDEATIENTLLAMQKATWVHLACHGVQDMAHPLNTGLILAGFNKRLALSEIIQKRSISGKFAFLSACQTASGDTGRPEESVHLAAGMLLAGYKGVVATMWSIRDSVAPVVAKKVYHRLLESGKPDSTKAAEALSEAVKEVQDSFEGGGFAYWVPFIHMGL